MHGVFYYHAFMHAKFYMQELFIILYILLL